MNKLGVLVLELLHPGKRDKAIQEYRRALTKAAGQELDHSRYVRVVNKKWLEERPQKAFVRK